MSKAVSVLTGGGTYTVSLIGTNVYSDSALTQQVSMPATVSADTTWYVTSRPQRMGVRITASDGSFARYDLGFIGTIDCPAMLVSPVSAPSSFGTSGTAVTGYDVVAPAPTGVAATDTAALNTAIADTPVGGRLLLPGDPATPYVIDQAIVIDKDITVEGRAAMENFSASFDVPDSPYFHGTVIKQTTAATDILQLSGSMSTVNLRRLGLVFDATIAGNTGHGVNATPATSTAAGLIGFTWDDIAVYGHDGNHYAYQFVNPMHGTTTRLRSYGGGGLYTECNSTSGNYGNLVHLHPYVNVFNAGTASGFGHSSRTSSGSSGVLNLITYIRPQCNVTVAGGQATWNDTLGTGVPKNIVAFSPDMENGPSATNVLNQGAGTQFIGGNQENRGDTNNTAYGYGALPNAHGGANTAVGVNALTAATTGHDNVAVGYQALQTLATSQQNTAVGSGALAANTGSQNVAVGYGALPTSIAAKNTAIGCGANTSSTGYNQTVAIGYQAIAGGQNAMAIGASTSAGAAGAVAIGMDNAGTAASTTTANAFVLGTALHTVQIKNNTTGAGSAALGANCPAVTATAPFTWFKMLAGDGSVVYVPAWK